MFKNKSLLQAYCNSLNGLKVLMLESAAKIEIFLLALTGALCLILPNFYTVIIFTLSWMLLALEAVNTAIEMLCNIYTQMYDEKIKKIKDLASSGVLLIVLSQISIALLWALSLVK